MKNKTYGEYLKELPIALLRTSDESKLHTAIIDLVRFGNLTFAEMPKCIDPEYADNILVNVMKKPLINHCKAAAVVTLKNKPGDAIHKLLGIHPPAHVIIVSRNYPVHSELRNKMNTLKDFT